MRRCVPWLGLTLVVATLTGCGLGPLTGPDSTPSPLPADQLVFVVQPGSNGWANHLTRTMATAALAVYGDGRVLQRADGESSPGRPAAYTMAQVEPLAVARFAAAAEEREVVAETTDFGEPTVSDQGTTTIALHGARGRNTVHVYAFDPQFGNGLTGPQRRARSELTEIVTAAAALAGDVARSPYTPDQVRVVELRSRDDDTVAGVEWPGPDLDGFLQPSSTPYLGLACGSLSGPDARGAYAAARDNPEARWTHQGHLRVLAVVPRLPGAPGCPG